MIGWLRRRVADWLGVTPMANELAGCRSHLVALEDEFIEGKVEVEEEINCILARLSEWEFEHAKESHGH